MIRFQNIILVVSVVVIFGCSSNDKTYLTEATGNPGDIVLFIDSTQWKGNVGTALKKYLKKEIPGLPRSEEMFNIITVNPDQKTYFLTQGRNLLYVFTLDKKTSGAKALANSLTEETINKIKTDTSFFVYTAEDQHSKGQKIMYLFGDTEEHLINHIGEYGEQIVEFFNKAERERIERNLLNANSTKGITAFLKTEQHCELRLPIGYKLADRQDDFIWFRKMEPKVDKDIFIAWKPYTSEYQLLPDSIIEWRDNIAKKYLFEDPERPDTYLLTEREIPFNPVRARQTDINGNFAMEVRGLWRSNTKGMGGPFVGYALVDKPKGLLYYIEGFTYSPSKAQREIVRELETTLRTFRTSDQLSSDVESR